MSTETEITPLKVTGTFRATIHKPFWTEEPHKKTGATRIVANLPFITECGHSISKKFYLTEAIIQSGNNKGKTQFQAYSENLVEVGAPAPFVPDSLIKMDGMTASIVVKEGEFNDVPTIEVAWVNKAQQKISNAKAASLFEKITGQKVEAAPETETEKPDPEPAAETTVKGKPAAAAKTPANPDDSEKDDDDPF